MGFCLEAQERVHGQEARSQVQVNESTADDCRVRGSQVVGTTASVDWQHFGQPAGEPAVATAGCQDVSIEEIAHADHEQRPGDEAEVTTKNISSCFLLKLNI